MAEFVIKSKAYSQSPVFDLTVSGKDLAFVEMSEEVSMAGSMKVFSFDTRNDAELVLTIRRVKGDLEIVIPDGWDVRAGLGANQATYRRLPRVDVYRNYERAVLGYVETEQVKLNFFKVAEVVQVEIQPHLDDVMYEYQS